MKPRHFKDRVGEVYGRLTVASLIGRKQYAKCSDLIWSCKCSCGNVVEVLSKNLVGGSTKSCGCLKKETREKQGGTNTLPPGVAALNNLYASYRAKAKKRGYSFSLSLDSFRGMTKAPCNYCGAAPSSVHRYYKNSAEYVYNGVDRVDNSVGYEEGNVVACCAACNKMKSDLSKSNFLNHIESILNHQRKGK